MKKQSIFIIDALVIGTGLFTGCKQGQKKAENATDSVTVKKEIYLQLYSVRDDIKADYPGTIAKVAEMGYTGVEAAGYATENSMT
jgi:outer membrane murein-binding lipoprotein Lpp